MTIDSRQAAMAGMGEAALAVRRRLAVKATKAL
jgi:hypothetical protein